MASQGEFAVCREQIIGALGEIGNKQARDYLVGLLQSKEEPNVKRWAVRALSTDIGAQDYLLELSLDSLPPEARQALADAMLEVDIDGDPSRSRLVVGRLKELAEDGSSAVRGTALGVYCVISIPSGREGLKLDREFLWSKLTREDSEAAGAFLGTVGMFDTVFLPEETSNLVQLASHAPDLQADIMLSLADMGDSRASDFMLESYRSGVGRIWALSYFAKNASPNAMDELREVVCNSSDASEVSLAAVALSSATGNDFSDVLIDNAAQSHPWVQKIVKIHLERLVGQVARTKAPRSKIINLIKSLGSAARANRA